MELKITTVRYREALWYEEGLSGKLGNSVYYQLRGKTFIRKAPVTGYNKVATEKQAVARERFKAAQQYALLVLSDPGWKAMYEKMANKKRTAYLQAMSDWFKNNKLTSKNS